jgi:hypothetical protein
MTAPTADGTTVPKSSTTSPGTFEWDVNPSAAWTLDCARPDGTVLPSVPVAVARRERAAVDLSGCSARWTG